MDSSSRRSRRSHPNLTHLSVTPLRPNFPLPLTLDHPSPTSPGHPSYLATRSVPQTPSILSRSNSRTRLSRPGSKSGSRRNLADLAFTPKSSVANQGKARTGSGGSRRGSAADPGNTGEWLLQTASVVAMSTAESKGQVWLNTRASSTSLVDVGGAGVYSGMGRREGSFDSFANQQPLDSAYRADDEISPVSTRRMSLAAGFGAGTPGRGGSAFGSRMGSRRGSRVVAGTPGLEMLRRDQLEEMERKGYFDQVDFVDDEEEEEGEGSGGGEEDGEIKRLVIGRAKGWVDWAVGWMDFRTGEEDDDGDELEGEEDDADGEGEGEVENEDVLQRNEVERRRRRRKRSEKDRILVAGVDDLGKAVVPAPEQSGVVGDAKWLLKVGLGL